ncbi:MAG: DUF2341 domain-containing protein [Candidatus Hodarchaeales archaeon]
MQDKNKKIEENPIQEDLNQGQKSTSNVVDQEKEQSDSQNSIEDESLSDRENDNLNINPLRRNNKQIMDPTFDWSYKTLISLNPTTPEADYQVKVQLNTSNFNYTKAQADADDLRFYDLNSNLLNYWIELWNNTGTSIIWVKISTAGTSEIEMYYGNPLASSFSNGDATFIFFDNFLGTSLNLSKWTAETDPYLTITINNSKVTIITDSPIDDYTYTMIGFNDYYVNSGGIPYDENGINLNRGGFETRKQGIWSLADNVFPREKWMTGEIRWINSSLALFINTTHTATLTTNIPTIPLQVGLLTMLLDNNWWGGGIHSIGTFGEPGRALRFSYMRNSTYRNQYEPAHLETDWLFVRKTNATEPVASLGYEQLHESLSDWSFKTSIHLNPVTPEIDYQIKVQLNTSTFNYSYAKVDGSDLRFYDLNGNWLYYWIETWNNTGTSIVWVKIPTSGTSEIEMYFGNPLASSKSNGDTTFIFFDDFLGTSIDSSKWTTDTGIYSTVTVANGKVKIITDNTYDWFQLTAIGFHDWYVIYGQASGGKVSENGTLMVNTGFETKSSDSWTHTTNVIAKEQWTTSEIRWINNSFVQYVNDTNTITHTTNIPNEPLQIRLSTIEAIYGPGTWWGGSLQSIDSLGQSGRALKFNFIQNVTYNIAHEPSHLECDWLFVRKTNATEPVANLGTEEFLESLLDWNYKKEIALTATPEDDYQIKIELNTSNFNYTKANVDGSDLRFYDLNTTSLNYWIESWNNTGTSIIWVKIPTFGTTLIEMYYGNPSASAKSYGDGTFIFFDDFTGSSLNSEKWFIDTDVYNSFNINNSIISIITDTPDDDYQSTVIGFVDYYIDHGQPNGVHYSNGISLQRFNFITTASSISTSTFDVISKEQWVINEFRWINSTFVEYENKTHTAIHTTNIPTGPLHLRLLALSIHYGGGQLYGGGINSSNGLLGQPGVALRFEYLQNVTTRVRNEPSQMKCDWLFVRNLNATEPLVSVGDELPANSTLQNFDIDGNADFINTASVNSWLGDGSLGNPFIIEDYVFSKASTTLISIQNTDMHFILRNNSLNGLNNASNRGIYLKNVTNGQILNNTVENTGNGFYFYNTNNILLTNNSVSNNINSGFYSYLSTNNSLLNNSATNNQNGFFLSSSNNNTFKNNYAFNNTDYGFHLRASSDNNTLSNNSAMNNTHGFFIYLSSYNTLNSNNASFNSMHGIFLYSSNNSNISFNFAKNNSNSGFFLYLSNSSTLIDNTASNNIVYGIRLTTSSHNFLSNNTLIHSDYGFRLDSSFNNSFNNNTMVNNLNGFFLSISDNNILNYNTASNNSNYGFKLDTSTNNTLNNNYATNADYGFRVDSSNNNTLISNTASNNDFYGFTLFSSNNNSIISNIIIDNSYYGIDLEQSNNSLIQWNDFIRNNLTGIQAFDNGLNNIFVNNYWDNHNNTDGDFNGFADNSYLIDGNAGTFDSSPKASPNIINHTLSIPTVISPNGGEILSDLITISWTDSIDSLSHSITYALQYSNDSGGNWSQIVTDLTNTSYVWNSGNLNGSFYLISVVVDDGFGLLVNDTSNVVFSIQNTVPHTLSVPTVISPNGGELLGDIITINWTASIDSLSHSLNYTLYYSNNSGSSWSQIVTGLTNTSYNWSSSVLPNGSNYMIKVVVDDGFGLSVNDTSDTVFTIQNIVQHTLSTPTVISPNGIVIFSGTETITWSGSIDSLGHSVNYTLYYSIDSGTTWNQIISSLTTTSYDWDTTTLPNGANYRIKAEATCSEGLTAEDTSDTSFSIQNGISSHTLSFPSVTSPYGGEIFTGVLQIHWSSSTDSLGHSVSYSVYYSADNGITWNQITSGLTNTSILWNTLDVPDGSLYQIKVIVICSEFSTVEDTSGTFTILNHVLSSPTVISPNGTEILWETVEVKWTASTDSLGHTVTYAVSYSIDNGTTWNLLGSGFSDNSFAWNTSRVPDGTQYLIRINTTCSEGLTIVDTSDATFTIQNHRLSIPTVTTPNGDETYSGIISIQWTMSSDTLDHSVTYAVSYSADNGTTWNQLASGLPDNNFFWNTSNVLDGSLYRIKIIATCSEDLIAEDISDDVFTIQAQPPTTELPTDTFTEAEEIGPIAIVGLVTIIGGVVALGVIVRKRSRI